MTPFNIADLTFRDLLRPEVLANPYPLFAQLRREDPVHEDPAGEGWLVTRYDDVAAVMGDPRFSAARLLPRAGGDGTASAVRRALARQMLFLDPPDHTRLRKLFAKAFTPGRLETLREPILQIIGHLFDAAARTGGDIDFVRDFAVPLPVTVIATMLGVPKEDHHRLRGWSSGFGRLISGRTLTPQEAGEAESSILAFIAYFQALIETRRRRPADDMLSDLVAVEEMGERLSAEELIVNLILLLAAGHGTTTHLLGNGLLALLRHPEQWRLLADDPRLAAPAVNELLRFDAPGPGHQPRGPGGRGTRGQGHPPGPAGAGAAGFGEPRRSALPGAGPSGHQAAGRADPILRPRHPHLSRRGPRAARGAGRLRGDHPPLPRHPAADGHP